MKSRVIALAAALVVLAVGVAVALLITLVGGDFRQTSTPTLIATGPLAGSPASSGQPSGDLPSDNWVASFRISPQGSEARFVIGEILRGQENTVIGSTSQVSGDIEVNRGKPAESSIGVIQIDAGTFVTDSSLRDRAIDNFILNASQYPQIVFEPRQVVGMPPEIQTDSPVSFDVEGTLTIRDISQPVTFSVQATLRDGPLLEGSAQATITRGDFNLTIPSVPQVASVEEAFILEFDFLAIPILGT